MTPEYDVKFSGVAGCGKTTAGLDWMMEQLDNGADPYRVAFVSFTRVACDVARDRLCSQTNLLPEDLPYCATIHALAKRALNIQGREWNQEAKLRDFADRYGYDMIPSRRGGDEEDLEEMVAGSGEDAPLLAIWNWGRSRLLTDPDAALRAFTDYDPEGVVRVNFQKYRQFVRDWEEDKQKNGRFDFTDLLLQVVERRVCIPVSAVAIDEAQDQSPLLWATAESLFARADCSAILADENQAIMSFQGANPDLFTNRIGRRTVLLEQSYRLPRRVADLALRVIGMNSGQAGKRILPREEEGEVREVPDLDALDFSNGESWMVLARNWYFVAGIISQLEARGIPYRVPGGRYYSPWDEKSPLRCVRIMFALSEGKEIPLGEVALLADKTRAETARRPGAWVYGAKAKLERLATAEPSGRMTLRELYQHGLTDDGLRQIVSHDLTFLAGITERDRNTYRAAIKAGQWDTPPQVRVGTVHSVKGDEADNVAMLQSATRMPARNLEDPVRCEEERRVQYVGVSRARKRFFAVEHSQAQPWELQVPVGGA